MGLGVVAALALLGLGVVESCDSRRVNSDRPPCEYIFFFKSVVGNLGTVWISL